MECKELDSLFELTDIQDDLVHSETLNTVKHKGKDYPIVSISVGSKDKTAPCLGLFGGVHGLEKIGSQVVLSYLSSLFSQMKWDQDLRKTLSKVRIVSIPIVNPVGMALFRRSNGNGVDLMRNAPVDAENATFPLASGHRIGPQLPWYRGSQGQKMEIEAQTLCNFVEKEMFPSDTSMAIDFHSGFGMKDRFWYPFAKSTTEFPNIREVNNIKDLFDQTFPHHIYTIESQSQSYTTHGDLWDYMYEKKNNGPDYKDHLFIPWTLEMGSWVWIKKNPLQAFSPLGLFHPIKGHRISRTMRRHLLLIDFFLRVVRNKNSWKDKNPNQ